ncbi:unnamed protein product, partial [Mesorhabditis belari]|uniref:Uncharacterized protein n=1 Tax=Mesorhabditis belari TaxID=2138241 RepID=A0AAF3EZ06_9BILA
MTRLPIHTHPFPHSANGFSQPPLRRAATHRTGPILVVIHSKAAGRDDSHQRPSKWHRVGGSYRIWARNGVNSRNCRCLYFSCNRQCDQERQDRQLERDRFNDKQQRGGGTPYSKQKKVADKTSIMKKGDTGKDGKVIEDGERDHPRLETKINASETIEEFEARVRDQFSRANVLNEIKEEEIQPSIQSGKNKRVEEIALELSVENLQRSESKAGQIDDKSLNEKNHNQSEKGSFHRNDSKVNVFNTDRIEEIDLNPALNNSINLETI